MKPADRGSFRDRQGRCRFGVAQVISASIRGWTAAFSLAVVLCGFAACHQQSGPARLRQTSAAEIAAAIQAWIGGSDPEAGALSRAEQAELNALYQTEGYSPLWLDARSRPDRDARAALRALHAAVDEGLDPSDYYASLLRRLAALLETEPPALPQDLARFDVALTSGTLRYLHDLHLGRVDPRTVGVRLNVPVDQHDFAALLRSALADHRIREALLELRPPFAQYRALRAMLIRYRELAADAALQSLPPSSTIVIPGQGYEGTGILHRLLMALGDLPAGTPAARSIRYEGEAVEGVKRFQVRHGLEPHGTLDQATLAALRTPLAWRVRQIELALERLRWLPHLGDERLVAINIPMFRLWAWDTILPNGTPILGMDVIVGRALGAQTPVFVEQMREVIFRPYWNLPRSILRLEILPILANDPDYLRRENMEIVLGSGDEARPVEITAVNIARLEQEPFRVRQRPGPGNALGLIKFVFPNDENVYMHGTPAQELFAWSRRDFSHGCVRVEDPVALAEWVLKDRPEWNRDRILAATAGSQSIRVKLARPIQVILFYTTAAVMPEDGTIRFAEDIYGHDARLDRALVRVEDLRR